MNIQDLYEQFKQSKPIVKIAVAALVVTWSMALVVLMVAGILLLERPSQAQQQAPGVSPLPAISLAPATGSIGSSITVQGENWPAGSMVLIYLSPEETEGYALASAAADESGRFSTSMVLPSDSRWSTPGTATVVAQAQNDALSAQATLNIVASPQEPTSTTETALTPTPSPTATSVPPTPTATVPQPSMPLATTTTDLNVRGGPGTAYPILGLLRTGQTAEVTGRSADGGWWQIKFLGVSGERGWISAKYAATQNTGNVPVVQAPYLPPTATPTPTVTPSPTAPPVVITDWRGEYYNNRTLGGSPVLVRNDVAVNFNWGTGSPAAGLPADNFSVRWTRWVNLPAGLYRIYVTADDGVRIWVDGKLVLDQWRDSSPTTYVADVKLGEGTHSFRIEYYEHVGGAEIGVSWKRQNEEPNQPPQAITGGPYSADEGSHVSFDGSRSKAFNGTHIDRYEWDFDYNDHHFTVDAVGKYALATYSDGPATYIIALRVTDSRGRTSQIATTQVIIRNVAPQVEAGGPYTGQVGQAISFAATATDPSPVDQAGLSYRWDFGDGASANGPIVSYAYSKAGKYTARLTVIDKDGGQRADTATVNVSSVNQAPVAVISGPSSGLVGQALTFSGLDSYDNDGGIVSYTWNFGDGATGNGINVSHSFGQPGTYRVTLTVVDDGGLIGSSAFNVQINEVVKLAPVANMSGPVEGLVNDNLTFDGSDSSDPDGHILTYTWDFGDGVSQSGEAAIVSHAYTQPGLYTVTLTVTDNDQLSDTVTQQITISEPEPADEIQS